MKNVFILDCKHEIDYFIAETIDVDLPTIDMNPILQDLIEILNHEELDRITIHGAAGHYIYDHTSDFYGDPVILDGAEARLYSAMLKLAGAIRNKLRRHHAYVDGQFPFTFQKFINNGTFYLTRK